MPPVARGTSYDYKVIGFGSEAKKCAVPFGHWSAEARAFVPVNRDGPVTIYPFRAVAYREQSPRILEGQLEFAKPINASAAERMNGGG
jgi:hypothetical protein